MIKDKNVIEAAMAYVIGQDARPRIGKDDFKRVCPDPDGLINVVATDVRDALVQLEAGFREMEDSVEGLVAFISSRVLTMRGLSAIIASFPPAKRMKGGLGFGRPKGGSVEIYLFVGLG